jgi:ribosome-binding factor A
MDGVYVSRRQQNRKKRPASTKHYPRTARLNALLQQVVAEYLERLDDDRLPFITVTGTEIDNDLNRCDVFISTLENDPERDDEILAVLTAQRVPLQSAIAQQVKLRKTPEVVIQFDPSVRAGARIDSILAGLDLPSDDIESTEDDPADPDEPDEVTFD